MDCAGRENRWTPLRPHAAAATRYDPLQLDGFPLVKPKVKNVDWEVEQLFHEADDPDRTAPKHDWEQPSFIARVDPVARAQETTARDIDVSSVKGCVPGFSFARAVGGVLQESECAEILQSLNGKGFTPALVNVGDGLQQFIPKYRDSYRVIQDSPPLADWFLQVLTPHLPATMEGSQSRWQVPETLTVSELNERCRFLCYVPGQQFKPHPDGGEMRRARGSPPDSLARDLSLITLQLYLHDMPAEHGGATRFIEKRESTFCGGNRPNFQPRAGSVLLFTQELWHEGALVTAERKFTMRSEVMYSGHHVPDDGVQR